MTPYGTPLHPLLVHFPIVLLMAGVVLSVIALLPMLHWLRLVELPFLMIGGLTLLVSKQTGETSADLFNSGIGRSPAALATFQNHERFANVTVLIFGGVVVLRLATICWQMRADAQQTLARKLPIGQAVAIGLRYIQAIPSLVLVSTLIGSLIGLVTLTLTGYYGGELVYTYGVGIHP